MKKIEDYLHLYLGCEVESNGSFIGVGKLTEVSIDTFAITGVVSKQGNNYRLNQSDFKLILRPLSDMSEEEDTENLAIWLEGNNMEAKPHSFSHDAESVRYLLSKHFDLFSLIESGLAIDATTLKITK